MMNYKYKEVYLWVSNYYFYWILILCLRGCMKYFILMLLFKGYIFFLKFKLVKLIFIYIV